MPEIFHYDEKNSVVIMTDVAGKDAKLLQHCLLAGEFNNQVASRIGQFLGIVPNHTAWGIRPMTAADSGLRRIKVVR